MDIPPGFSNDQTAGKICRLCRSLYGLKQSPRAWFGRFSKAMRIQGYKQSNADHTLFIRSNGPLSTFLIVYVDGIVVTGSDTTEIALLKRALGIEFEIKDLGQLLIVYLGRSYLNASIP